MDSWPLSLQWAVLLVVGGAYLGFSWWLALARARAAGTGPVTWSGSVRTFVRSFGFADWAMIALLLVFFVPLVIRTIAGA